MMGDGECSEGSVWEAMAFASHYQLDNLVAIMDVNRLGQSEAAPLKHDMEAYRKRSEAFGLVLNFFCENLISYKLTLGGESHHSWTQPLLSWLYACLNCT